MKHILFLTVLVLVSCAPMEQVVEPTSEKGSQEVGERLLPSGLLEIGSPDAKTVLMLFTEHHCKYCKQFHKEQYPRLYEEFIETGDIKLQIGILPLKKYTDARRAAVGMLCSAAQGKGVAMHEMLFALGAGSEDVLISEAVTLELNVEEFTTCIRSSEADQLLTKQTEIAESLGVTLVPTFFLNGEKSVGLPYYADLRGMMRENLKN